MIATTVSDGFGYIQALSLHGLVSMFWFVLIFELPRYTLSFIAAAFFSRQEPDPLAADLRPLGRISVIIAGHNEEKSIEGCVRCLWEQSLPPDEIVVVSDGSSDKMAAKIADLLRRGLISKGHCTGLRAGKAAASNLAERLADGDILINIDCDCSLDRHALKRLVQPFADPEIGAVSGNIAPRNAQITLISAFQAIEYLISISLGKKALDMIGQVSCASGAFSGFRREALRHVEGLDSGSGEDLDLTLRLRRAGWRVAFACDAICYTDVPATLPALMKQRFRWERDAVALRYRRHLDAMNPFSKAFKPSELFHELEFLLFNVVGALALPFYFIWLFSQYGDLAPAISLAALAGITVIDVTMFLVAGYATPKLSTCPLLPYVLGYSLFNGVFMRVVRLTAYLQEWVFKASYNDSYVPDKVHRVRA